MLIILGKNKELQKINYTKYIKTKEVKHLDLMKQDFSIVISEAESSSIFTTDKKTIVIHNWSFLLNGKSSFNKTKIIDFFNKAKKDHDFILLFNNDRESKTIKDLAGEFDIIKPINFANYEKKVMIMSLLKKEAKEIEINALNYLINTSSNSPQELSNTIKKLSLLNDRTITLNHILNNVKNSKSENIFIPMIVKKIIFNNYKDVINDYRILKDNGWSDVVIISILLRCLIRERNKVILKSKQINYKHDLIFVKITFVIKALLNLDLKIKKSEIDSEVGIQLLLLRLKEKPWMH